MFNDSESLGRILTGQSPLIIRDAKISTERFVGCDVIRRDALGRNVVVLPKGHGVDPSIPLTEREQALVRPAPKYERRMRASGHGFYFEDVEVS